MRLLDIFKNKGENKIPYIIAEAGVNHEGNMDLAKRLIDEAKEGGAHAIKFQTYKADTIASKDSPSYWDLKKEPTTSQYELFTKYDKFWKEEFQVLKDYCDKVGIEFLSTPFDVESADFLNEMMDVYKISSSDITNKPFIEYMCKFGKPIILSTGGSCINEVKEAVEWIKAKGNDLSLLHCVLNYPTEDINANLGMIKGLKSEFPNTIIGYSDHTLPNDMKVLEIATLLGAEIIEKHFTFDKSLPGNDHYHAMDKEDLKVYFKLIERNNLILGQFDVDYLESEAPARKHARRSLVALKDIPKGKTIEYSDLTWKRPAHGVSPKYIDSVIGKIASKNIIEDEVILESFYE